MLVASNDDDNLNEELRNMNIDMVVNFSFSIVNKVT